MAVQAAAALLDELMGRYRNLAPNDKTKDLNWEDPEFCKYYMVKFCPHDLFVNTRADLGACPKVHDDEVKDLFEKSTSSKKQAYEDEFIRFAQSMLNEVERKIVKGKQRLALMSKSEPPSTLSAAQTQRNDERIKLLLEKINKLVNEAEAAGIEGNVEQAQGLMKLCDQLKDERETLQKQNENSAWSQTAELAAAQEKQMEVCEVCGAFLIVGDAQSRIDDHLQGKQHVGYQRLRTSLEEIMAARAKEREEKEKRREEERRERTKARDKDKDIARKKRDDDRDKDNNRDKDRERDRDRDRSRDRKRRDDDRHSSRDHDRDRNDRDRDRSKRDERRRSHDNDKDRESRERDRDRKKSRHDDRHSRKERSSDSHRRRRD
uniref:Luc7-like protein 3 n=1 Tax=Lygus hesperus TaxID=30085 RepID=A0A0A9YKK2_LYGHE